MLRGVLSRIWAVVTLCLVLVTAVIAVPGVAAAHGTAPTTDLRRGATAARSTTLADAPASLRRAVVKDFGSGAETGVRPGSYDGIRHLGAEYSSAGVRLTGPGFTLSVGRGSVGRPASMEAIGAKMTRRASATLYGDRSLEESYRPTASGFEQSFTVADRMTGSGPLAIDVPVMGLSATDDGSAIDLHDARGRIRDVLGAARHRR